MKSLFLMLFSVSLIIFAASGCGNNNEHSDMHDQDMHDQSQMDERNILDSTVVREENVDVASLDENQDGKLFQCPMDYEVISDVDGNCPMCKMKLEEYTVEETKTNLDKYLGR